MEKKKERKEKRRRKRRKESQRRKKEALEREYKRQKYLEKISSEIQHEEIFISSSENGDSDSEE